jgi:hypothetical protein
MSGLLRHRLEGTPRPERKEPPGPSGSDWTEATTAAILAAFDTFLHNQARKHGVAAVQVRALIRAEVLDPDR